VVRGAVASHAAPYRRATVACIATVVREHVNAALRIA